MIYTPISKFLDWLSAFINLIFIPFFALFLYIIITTQLTNNESFIFLTVIILLLLVVIVPYYQSNYKILTKFAIETSYVHFKPSNKDLILGFYGQAFVVIILMVIMLLFLPGLLNSSNNNSILIIAFGIALLLQLFTFILINRSKIKLIETANTLVDPLLIEKINAKTPDVRKIKNFVYADIKPASLFLSAGVTNYSFHSHICLISRYFQLKLTEKELMSVIGHEIGHVVHKDMLQSQLLLNLQAIARFFLIYLLFSNLEILFSNKRNDFYMIVFKFSLLVAIIIIQLLASFSLQLRTFNQEILADEYGASLMGNYNLAYTLKKLPNVMPAPVDDSPFQFLGFRTAILFSRAKQLNEIDESIREFSRFSNN